jgi:adenylylsulfate kinase
MSKNNLVWHQATVTREARQAQNGHKSAIIWFTGLSGAGKSTIAHALEERLHKMGCRTFVLDGDNVRHGLCSDLSFSVKDREENIRRVGEIAKLFLESGAIVLTAFISPFRSDRERVRNLVMHGDFMEVYCKCSLEICESRDVKGMYKKAREGKIAEFTGISSPYEEPYNPELVVETDGLSIDESASKVLALLAERGVVNLPS